MKLEERKILFLGVFFLFLITACATPSFGIGQEIAPTPVVDEADVATMIAEAAALKVSQTLEAMPPTATSTIISTETPLPSPTATEIPPTATPTEVDYPTEGNDLQKMENGGFLYQDYTGAYEISIPEEWLALRPGGEEYTQAWGLPEASDQTIRNELQSMQSLDPNVYRLFGLDIREGHYSTGVVTHFNLVLNTESEASLEETFAQAVLDIPDTFPSAVMIDSILSETEEGIPYGIIEWEVESPSSTGGIIQLYKKEALFMVKNHALLITFTSPADFKEQALEEFDAMLESFRFLD